MIYKARAVVAIIAAALVAAFAFIVEQCKRLQATRGFARFSTNTGHTIGFCDALVSVYTIYIMCAAGFGRIAFAAAVVWMR